MTTPTFRAALAAFHLFALPASAAVVDATFNNPTDVPVTAASYTATGNTVNLTLNFAPATGTNLIVVKNTGLAFIQGTFDNLKHGQILLLSHGGVIYPWVANYYGGTGNDLVLQSANNRVMAWGRNDHGQLGNNSTTDSSIPVATANSGILYGNSLISLSAGGRHSLALCSNGIVAAWGKNGYGELGNNSTTDSTIPVLVNNAGALSGKTVIAISAGGDHSLALSSDGTVAAWGYNHDGELGNNSSSSSSVPVAVTSSGVLSGTTVVAIAAGYDHSLTLCSNGTVAAWGENGYGQLGNNSTADSSVPVAVNSSGVLAGKTVVAIAAGGFHSIALCSDGTVAAWGYNGSGQLGNNNTTSSTVPVSVTTSGVLSGKAVVAIAAGNYHSFALCSDGTMVEWGDINGAHVPAAVPSSTIFSGNMVAAINAGSFHSLALCADGTIATWGNNSNGQLGNNSTTNSSSPVAVNISSLNSGERFVAAMSGQTADHNLAMIATPWPSDSTAVATAVATSLTGTGAILNGLVCASGNPIAVSFEYGLTSSYGTTASGVPSQASGNELVAISANINGLSSLNTYHYRVIATNASGTIAGADMTFVTASNNSDLAGLVINTGTLSPSFSTSTTEYTASVSNATASINVKPTLADVTASVRVNGIVVSSGSYSGAIGLAAGPNVISTVVTAQDLTTKTYTVIVTRKSANADLFYLSPSAGTLSPSFSSATTSYTAIVTLGVSNLRLSPTVADGAATVRVNGTTVTSGTPSGDIALTVGSNTITIVVTAQNANTKTYTLTVTRSTNLVYTYNSAADLPAIVTAFTATGSTASITLNYAPLTGSSLTVVNNTGSLPITGTFSNLIHGQMVSLAFGGVNYSFVANYYGGTGNDLVLQWANTWPAAWGSNSSGQLGNNSLNDSATPVAVTRTGLLAGKTILALAVGSSHSLALSSDGTVSTWGSNSFGQLGNNSTTDSLVPLALTSGGVLSGKTVVVVAAGQYHNLALCSDGTFAAWGYNFYGQLGNNSTTQSNVPVSVNKTGVLSGKIITAIACGNYQSYALCSDGTLAAWGYNGNGELGNNGTGYSTLPVAVDRSGVLAGKTISAISAGSFHGIALCTDGTLAGWGLNAYGQLGNNTIQSASAPVLVDASGVLAGKTIVSAATGAYHTLALCSDGTIAAWGSDSNGELGDGGSASRQVPVSVDSSGVIAGKSVVGISAGSVHSLARCTDGTIAAWGYNGDGELGNNSTISSRVPVAVSSSVPLPGQTYVSASTGSASQHSLALIAAPPLPVVTTFAAAQITGAGAEINGGVNASGSDTVPVFEYGLTLAFGNSIAATPTPVTGTSPVPVSATLTGLNPGTTYYYRLKGTSVGGTTYGAAATFTTTTSGVTEPPSITGQPADRTNIIGTTTTFTVTATSTLPLSYQWRKGGATLSNTGNISGATTATLTLANAQLSDAGSYSVVVTDANGSVPSTAATLTVIEDPLAAAVDSPGLVWTTGGNAHWFAQSVTTHDGVGAARSGAITDNQESWMQTTLIGSGTLGFWWKVSSEDGWDMLEFYLDGVLQGGAITGETNWQQRILTIPAGTHTVKWRYVKDDSISSGQDAGWVDQVNFVPDLPVHPQIVTQPASRINVAGTTATFTVTATGTVPLTYQWRKNDAILTDGGNISGATTATLTLANVQLSDVGAYTVVVANAYDSVTSTGANLALMPPAVSTGAASGITATSAILNGTVNPNGLASTARFDYGLTSSYGGKARVTLSPDSGSSVQNVSMNLSGLQAGRTYHYRITATSGSGTSPGVDMTFATPAVPISAAELVAPKVAISRGNVCFTVHASVAGRAYQLQCSDTMAPGSWQDLGQVKIGDGNDLPITTPCDPAAHRNFYRLALQE